MRFDTIVLGGTVVNADGLRRVDVGIRGRRIVAVAKRLARHAGDRTTLIDAAGKYVIPGAVDAARPPGIGERRQGDDRQLGHRTPRPPAAASPR